jgi:4-aminobutyrate--pyruvate transaminase
MTQLIYPTTNLGAVEQLIITRGEGVYVYDQHGRRYLEGLAGLWCTALGYGNEELVEAAASQMRTLAYQHLFGGKTHPTAMALADRLAEMLPLEDAHVFFGTSGSDANDTHWKLLRYYFNSIGKPEKRKIIARKGAYHGVTVAAAAFTALQANHTFFDLPVDALGVIRTEGAHFYRQGRPAETEDDFASRLAVDLEQLILREGADSIAAFIAEPVSGAGGVVVPPKGYWEKIQAVLCRHEILLIDDEVITGFGRTGNDFGATTFGIRPDMMTLAKALTSGYLPLSVSAIRGEMYERLIAPSKKVGVFGHGYTYSGHPVSCAVALKTLEIFERDRVFEHAARVGSYLQRRLRTFESHPLVGEVRGVGMIAALELVADKHTRQPFDDNQAGLFAQARAQVHGLMVRALAGSCIAICPPLIITESQIDEIIDALGKALDETLSLASRKRWLTTRLEHVPSWPAWV